jgi:RND family efflux transporter MFP subunit
MRGMWIWSVAAIAALGALAPQGEASGPAPGTVASAPANAAGGLATAVARSSGGAELAGYDGVVEAVRQTVVAAQVAGTVIALDVKAGDTVKAGQVLARIDAQAAAQSVAASDAQVQSARASLEVATREFERQKQLYEKKYTSQAALERAEAQFKATQAQVAAQIAQAGGARVQSGFYVVKAPYAGVIAEVPVALGDMAMPGKPLLTIYDPAALRVSVAVPQTVVAALPAGAAMTVELPGVGDERARIVPTRIEILPTVDPGTHTQQVRLDLPVLRSGTNAITAGVRPGTFARAWLPSARGSVARTYVPASAIVRRAEMTGLYVIDAEGKPVLRQVRLGRADGESVEILAGVGAGERVALDPQAAARVR